MTPEMETWETLRLIFRYGRQGRFRPVDGSRDFTGGIRGDSGQDRRISRLNGTRSVERDPSATAGANAFRAGYGGMPALSESTPRSAAVGVRVGSASRPPNIKDVMLFYSRETGRADFFTGAERLPTSQRRISNRPSPLRGFSGRRKARNRTRASGRDEPKSGRLQRKILVGFRIRAR